ncbi:hypothetical protein ACEQ6C_39660, partial [Rhizobium ruizarguesonis]
PPTSARSTPIKNKASPTFLAKPSLHSFQDKYLSTRLCYIVVDWENKSNQPTESNGELTFRTRSL